MRTLIGIALFLFWAACCFGQGTYTAASCSRADVNDCINGSGVNTCHLPGGGTGTHTAVNGDTIVIPSTGSPCTWTTGITVSGKGIDITGTGTPNTGGGTFGAGTANTTIVDHVSGDLFTFSGLTSGETAKLELLALSGSGGSSASDAILFAGTCTTTSPYCASIRLDNITFVTNTWSTLSFGFVTTSNVFGVLDHNSMSDTCVNGCPGASVFVTPNFGEWQGVGEYGDNSMASPDTFGTAQEIYIENNVIDGHRGTDVPGGSPSETDWGGSRFVCRFNHFITMSQSGMCPVHGTAWSGRMRGTRQEEIYYNTAVSTASGYSCLAMSNELGSAAIYLSNSMTNQACQAAVNMDIPRFELQGTPWNSCDGTQPWDQTPFSSSSACLDQPGTGAGALFTSDNPPRMASAPSTACSTAGQCWPNPSLDPVYEAGETASGGLSAFIHGISSGASGRILANRDYYAEVSASPQSSTTSPFNGTSGTGYGTLANRPPCTSGCTIGVGYWATDQGTWNTYSSSQEGILYVLTAPGTWSAHFTPYTYPHPLEGSSTQVATPTFSPAAGTYASSQTVTISDSTSGATICYTLDGTTPTTNGAGTCTHGNTYSVALVLSSTKTLAAIGTLSGDTDSSVASGLYTINIPAVAPGHIGFAWWRTFAAVFNQLPL